MKYILLLFCFSFNLKAQNITRFAGCTSCTVVGDGGPATAALLDDPDGSIFKDGVFYFASLSGNRIRRIGIDGIISTIAGNGSEGYSGDGGPATMAKLKLPVDVALDSIGNLYFSEGGNNTVRRVNMTTGVITTVCGNGTAGFFGDGGQATAALLYAPDGICFDKFGNLYISDGENNRIRKINTSGIITTFAGNGTYGFSGVF